MCVVSAAVGTPRSAGTTTPTRQAIVATADHTTVTLNDVKSLSTVFIDKVEQLLARVVVRSLL